MRTINLLIDSDDMAEVMDAVHALQLKQAIGYLSLWGFPSFPVVDIHPDGKTDLLAVYTDPARPDRRYVIGAVWSDSTKSYSFHS